MKAIAGSYLGARSAFLEGATYTRVAEVALEWTPTARFGGAIRNSVTISLEGRNLVTWTSFQGPDPEIATAIAGPGFPRLPSVPALARTIGLRVDFVPR